MTEYEYKYYSFSQKMTQYEYKYYSASQKWLNMSIIQLPKNDQIRILFVFPKMTKYKIYSASENDRMQ